MFEDKFIILLKLENSNGLLVIFVILFYNFYNSTKIVYQSFLY